MTENLTESQYEGLYNSWILTTWLVKRGLTSIDDVRQRGDWRSEGFSVWPRACTDAEGRPAVRVRWCGDDPARGLRSVANRLTQLGVPWEWQEGKDPPHMPNIPVLLVPIMDDMREEAEQATA